MRPLGPILAAAALVLTGCGSDTTDGSRGAESPAEPSYEQVALLSVTEGGGEVTERLTYVDDEASLDRYVEAFPSEQLQREVLAAAEHADVADGDRLAAAIVAIGCSPPTDVVVSGSGADLRISASGKPTADIQCLAPITTVALVAVSAS